MAGHEHMMRGELDVEFRSDSEYVRAVRQWISGALDGVFAAEIGVILDGPDLDPQGVRSNVPCGPPGSLWGFCLITQRGARGLRDTARVISEANLAWLDKKITETAPFAVVVGISQLGDDGRPHARLARITAEREESADAWVRLSCEMPEGSLRDERFREAFVRFMKDRAAQENPSFGHVAYQYTLGKTAMEAVLGPPWLMPKTTLAQSRTHLRGYGWVTVCPKELASSLDVASLRGSGDFHEAEELPGGALWLRATRDFADYNDERVRGVWAALSPVLRAGVPKRSSPRLGAPPLPVVYEDAHAARR